MNYRKLFQEIVNYGQFDRMPVIHWHGWDETHERWYAEGGLWFKGKTLVDYDGVFSLSHAIIDKLEENGYDVSEMKD